MVFGGAGFIVLCTLPILAKWVLIGRWKPQQIRIWSLKYFRFWLVKTLIKSNPLVLVGVGSPLYTWYLRALGAKIGRGTVIFTRHVPVCTDLLTIGPDTVIRKESFFNCYRAYAGWIQTGRVTIGRNVFIGEKTVLDINSAAVIEANGGVLEDVRGVKRRYWVPTGAAGAPAGVRRVLGWRHDRLLRPRSRRPPAHGGTDVLTVEDRPAPGPGARPGARRGRRRRGQLHRRLPARGRLPDPAAVRRRATRAPAPSRRSATASSLPPGDRVAWATGAGQRRAVRGRCRHPGWCPSPTGSTSRRRRP